MELSTALYELEQELAGGDGDTYRRRLADDAVVVIPGETLSKMETVAAMVASPRWDDFQLDDRRFTQLSDDAALLTYRFTGHRRDDDGYIALMGSVYVNRDGTWLMAFHQQTPLL